MNVYSYSYVLYCNFSSLCIIASFSPNKTFHNSFYKCDIKKREKKSFRVDVNLTLGNHFSTSEKPLRKRIKLSVAQMNPYLPFWIKNLFCFFFIEFWAKSATIFITSVQALFENFCRLMKIDWINSNFRQSEYNKHTNYHISEIFLRQIVDRIEFSRLRFYRKLRKKVKLKMEELSNSA